MTLLHPRLLLSLAFMLGLVTILGAWGFEWIGGYQPCALCLQQRWPYYLGLPLLAPLALRPTLMLHWVGRVLIVLVLALFLYGAYLGAYHAGAEWDFWDGPQTCAVSEGAVSIEDFGDVLNQARILSCTEVQWRFLGLSFAGYNALICLALVVMIALAWVKRFRLRLLVV